MNVLYAEIIVDVSTYHVDRSFDYAVPVEWVAVIEKGCRVKVPFETEKCTRICCRFKT
ncbi:hypothetical protein LSPH24S_01439 [Lysinibacillus sphaericus]